jgi:hypothetical protein
MDLARRWVAPERVSWRRWALAAASGVAFAVSVMGEPDIPCSADDPAFCGPDLTFSLAIVLALATVALLWWRPFVAAGCAVAFAVLDLLFDEVWTANVAWPLVAALHVAHVVVLRRGQARQRALAERASVPLPVRDAPAAGPRSAAGRLGPYHLGAALLAVVAAGCIGMLVRAEASDRAHLARSEVVRGTVSEVSDDEYTIGIRLDRGQGRPAEQIELEPYDVYDVGDDVLVRLDPTDPGWSHLVAEPPDRTWWASLSLGAGLLAVLLAERPLTARMRRGAFLAHPPTHGVPVRAAVDEMGGAVVACVDRDVVFAGLDTLAQPGSRPDQRPEPDDSPEVSLKDEAQLAHLVGDLRPGGWCAIVAEDGIRLPEGPLEAIADLPTFTDVDAWDEEEEDPRVGTDPVPADVTPAALPVHRRPQLWERLVGAAATVALTAFGLWMMAPEDIDWFQAGGVALGCLAGARWAVGLAVDSVTVDRDAITLRSALQRSRVPMADIVEVRCSSVDVVLVTRDQDILEFGPVEGGPAGRHGPGPLRAAPVSSPTASEVAAAIDHARVAAGSVHASPVLGPLHLWARVGPGAPWLAMVATALVGRYVSAYLL